MRADLAEEMVAVLGDLGDLATSDEERAWLAVIQGIWHSWIVGDRAGATSELASVQDLLGAPWDKLVACTRGGLDIQSGGIGTGLRLLEGAVPGEGAPTDIRVAHDSPMAAGLVLNGRLRDSLVVAERAMPLALAQGDGSTAALTEILMSSSWAKVGLGRYDEVRTESRALSDLLAEADDDEGERSSGVSRPAAHSSGESRSPPFSSPTSPSAVTGPSARWVSDPCSTPAGRGTSRQPSPMS